MSDSDAPADLLDLKLLPAWVKGPAGAHDYSHFEGEESDTMPRGAMRPRQAPDRKRKAAKSGSRNRGDRHAKRDHFPQNRETHRKELPVAPLARSNIAVTFLPHGPSLANVIAQIKSGTVAYSVFALARMFLEKPERYHVKLGAPPASPLFQLGEGGPVSTDRQVLENSAFAFAKDDFYKIEVIQTEPLKGNFSNVARCRLSGTLLGPTNHHSYQPQLRTLYEQRYSRRMSFADYQRQIEILSDPAAVEQWKEQARNLTTFSTRRAEPPASFTSSAEAERHFRQNYLPELLRHGQEFTINGVMSRRLPDRALGRAIEEAWSHESRSPSRMMQMLAAALRSAGLNIFRHRRGIFVSPIRSRHFGHELSGVSHSIGAILEAIAAAPGINRKNLGEKLVMSGSDKGAAEYSKLTLAAELKWLISEGYVIEFNDGSLDLPQVKAAAPVPSDAKTAEAVADKEPNEPSIKSAQDVIAAATPAAESDNSGA